MILQSMTRSYYVVTHYPEFLLHTNVRLAGIDSTDEMDPSVYSEAENSHVLFSGLILNEAQPFPT